MSVATLSRSCCVPSCTGTAITTAARCAQHERARIASKRYAAEKRAAARAARQADTLRCQFGQGAGVCGGSLEPVVDRATGRVGLRCARCERRRAGICRDCPRRVAGTVGRSLRCATCAARETKAAQARYRAAHPEAIRAKDIALQADPERHQRKLEYKRAWRKANREKVRQQKRRAALKQPARVRRYMERYRAKYREHYRLEARARYYAEHPERPTPVCVACGGAIPYEPPGAPMKRCDACVYPSERRRREAVRAARQARLADAPDFGQSVKPVKVRRPRGVAARVDGARLCLTPGCVSVVRGRTKKCGACKAVDALHARARVGVGRGRRIAA